MSTDSWSPFNSREKWRMIDPAPELALQEIYPLSVRARALVVRSNSSLLQTNFLQLRGVPSILAGMEYHFDALMKWVKQTPQPENKNLESIRHETIAWLNRVGQYHYFTRSHLVKSRLPNLVTPVMDEIIPFRMKYSAHRSIDYPKGDTFHFQVVNSMILDGFGGSLWSPRPDKVFDRFGMPGHETHFLHFQLQIPELQIPDGKVTAINLSVEETHPLLMEEAYSVFELLLCDD